MSDPDQPQAVSEEETEPTRPAESPAAHAPSAGYLEELPGGVCAIRDRQIQYLNTAAAQLLGCSDGAPPIGRPLSDLALIDDRECLSERLSGTPAGRNGTAVLEFRVQHPDGRVRRLAFHYKVAAAGDVSPLLLGTLTDITDQAREDEYLRLTAAVFDNSLEGVIVCDQDRRILMVNPAFSAITGYGSADAIGRTPAILHSGRHGPGFYQEMWEMIELSGHWEGEVWNKRKNGEVYPEYLSITAITDDDGLACSYIGVFTDISHRKLSDQQIHRLVHYDKLTDLPNRDSFLQQLKSRLVRARATRRRIAVIYLDVDHFKAINDSLGHQEGDHLLQTVASRLKRAVRCGDRRRPCDVVARLGGDEFVILVDDLTEPQESVVVAEKLLEKIEEPVSLDGQMLNVDASLGIAVYPDDGDNVDDLLRNADMAMYHAKQNGRGQYRFFTERMRARIQRHLKIRGALHTALDQGELRLVYQPQVSAYNDMIRGVEALLRWRHPEWGPMSPMEFVPILEEDGEIERVGRWVIDQACQACVAWKRRSKGPLRVAVNLSARQLRNTDLVTHIARSLDAHGLPASCFEVELTESLAMDDVAVTQRLLASLHELGVRVSIDDFGTGYSSLSYLQNFQIDALKIDRSFIRHCVANPHDRELTRSIIALAKSMELEVIAEGVETEEQRIFLTDQQVDLLQGYRFSRPVTAEAIHRLIEIHNNGDHSAGGRPVTVVSSDDRGRPGLRRPVDRL